MEIKKLTQFAMVAAAMLAMASACKTKIETVENEIIKEVPSYPDLQGQKADTLFCTRAEAQFYGAYSELVDRWYLMLYTGKSATYDLGTDTYSGDGQLVKLCMQTKISKGRKEDWGVMVQHYTEPDSYSELQIGQWEFGYDNEFDHPYYGKLWGSYGSYFVDLDKSSYEPLMFMEGDFNVAYDKAKNEYTVEGMLVDGTFTKRYFVFKGDFTQIEDYEFPGAPDTSLSKDITLTRAELPKLSIFDRGDQYRYENPPRYSNYRVFLSGNDINFEMPYKSSPIKMEGEGPVMLLDLFVNPDANGKIPAGEYKIVKRLPNYGIDGADIWPFKVLEGYPHYYFTTLQGSWYFNLASSGYWQGDYGRVTDGSVFVSYQEGSDSPVIKAELKDCGNPSHNIIIDWK